jgi:hypothetical protein
LDRRGEEFRMGMENKWDDKEHKVKLRGKGKRKGREAEKRRTEKLRLKEVGKS